MDLHQLFNYDPESGHFTWLEPMAQSVKPGDRAGYTKDGKYRFVKIGSKAYAEHRLAWLYMTGSWPEFEIDHRNRIKNDNRFENLRAVTRKQNSENANFRGDNVSGFRGVSWFAGKWAAYITHFGKKINLGAFSEIEDAKKARLKAETTMFTHANREAD